MFVVLFKTCYISLVFAHCQDSAGLKLSEDATGELPSSNFTRFSHFSGNTQRTKLTRLQVALGYLRLGRLSPIDLLIHVLDPETPKND